MAAGRDDEALPFYTRALDRAAAVLDGQCPPRLCASYLKRKRIRDYVATVEDLSLRSGEQTNIRNYRELFGLD